MAEEPVIELEGKILQVLPGTMFRIELPNKHVVLGRIFSNGQMSPGRGVEASPSMGAGLP